MSKSNVPRLPQLVHSHYPEAHGRQWWCQECLQVLDTEDSKCDTILLAERVQLLERKVEEAKGAAEMLEINTRSPRSMPVDTANEYLKTANRFLVAMLKDLNAKE